MESYDFIIVGGGAAGCLLASRLSHKLQDHTFLLIEAGGKNTDVKYQNFGERLWTLTTPGYNWGYTTVPQPQLVGRSIDCSRGKGLGGSTAINFCVYTKGSSADYDQWAEIVGDDSWRWENAQRRFGKIERFHYPSSDYEPFVHVSPSAHGFDGPVDVGLTDSWDPSFGKFLKKLYQYHPKNLDHNSGDPLGVSVCQFSAFRGQRTTASGAYLSTTPPNLTIKTDAAVRRVLFQGKKVVGVELLERKIYARKEVILSAGAINSPKILLLSGIGPKNDLQRHGIPIIQESPAVGKNFYDHLFLSVATIQKPGGHHRSSYIDSPTAYDEARKQWKNNQTGPLSLFYLPQLIAFFKSNAILNSKEFKELDQTTKKVLQAETKPSYEIYSQISHPGLQAPEQYLATAACFAGSHGGGEITLQSADPDEPPVINPNYLAHPFDRRVAIESVRETLDFLNTRSIANDHDHLIAGPTGSSEDEILVGEIYIQSNPLFFAARVHEGGLMGIAFQDYVRKSAMSMWHMCGSVKMGKVGQRDTCVDKDFRVVGVQALRVVDLSVAPLLPTAHTQSVAYLIGETAAEKIIAEYS